MVSTDSRLRAGSAQVDITPGPGAALAGGVAVKHSADSVLDPLYAKALVLEQDGEKLCILTLDVTLLDRDPTERIRAAVQEECGIARHAIMVHATQTHSAPAVGSILLDAEFPMDEEYDFLRLKDDSFIELVVAGSIEAIVAANNALKPARIGWQNGALDTIAFNRRGIRRDGTCGMPWTFTSVAKPLGQTDYLYTEGPIDPEVGVVWIQDEKMRSIAFLLHYTCHPVNVFYYRGQGWHGQISADWPGAWASQLVAAHGGVGVVLNGSCGNINPWPTFEADFKPDHQRMGSELSALSEIALGRISFSDTASLSAQMTDIPLAIREIDADKLTEAKQRIAEYPDPQHTANGEVDMAWYAAAMLVSLDMLRSRGTTEPYEVQAFRIGDIGIVGLPGEPFVEGQLRLKIESPAIPTYVAHCTSHYAGYLPTPEAFPRGGHEVDLSWWSRHEPEALDQIVDTATGLLKGMFATD
jgi:neutral ceramidase